MRGVLLSGLATAASLALAVPAHGAVTIGSSLASPANEPGPCNLQACTVTNLSLVPGLVAAGGITSPVNGTVTSWRFKSNSAGQEVQLRVLRGSDVTYTGAGVSAPTTSVIGINGPSTTSLPIRVGDRVGLDASAGAIILSDVGVPSTAVFWNLPPLAEGDTRAGQTVPGREILVQADVEPANTLDFGAVTRNKKKGTATLTVNVPNPGRLEYSGTGVNIAETAAVKTVTAPGPVRFLIRATGKKRKKLNKKGKVKVAPTFTFTPNAGTAATSSTKVKLLRKRKSR
jgi:hypothetical protein